PTQLYTLSLHDALPISQEPIRTTFLYNNLMFAAVGQIIEIKSGRKWEDFVRERIFTPLDMSTTCYTIAGMLKQPDYGVPFREKRSEEHTSELQSRSDLV